MRPTSRSATQAGILAGTSGSARWTKGLWRSCAPLRAEDADATNPVQCAMARASHRRGDAGARGGRARAEPGRPSAPAASPAASPAATEPGRERRAAHVRPGVDVRRLRRPRHPRRLRPDRRLRLRHRPGEPRRGQPTPSSWASSASGRRPARPRARSSRASVDPAPTGSARPPRHGCGAHAAILKDHDWVFFTQRGTQGAEPFLDCEGYSLRELNAGTQGLTPKESRAAGHGRVPGVRRGLHGEGRGPGRLQLGRERRRTSWTSRTPWATTRSSTSASRMAPSWASSCSVTTPTPSRRSSSTASCPSPRPPRSRSRTSRAPSSACGPPARPTPGAPRRTPTPRARSRRPSRRWTSSP